MDPITLFFLIVLIFSIIIHEVSHGYAAEILGDPTARLQGRLTLNPLPHIDPLGSILIPALLVFTNAGFLFGWAKPVPYNPYNLNNKRWGEALVAAAGPGANIILALLFGTMIRFAHNSLSPYFIQLAGVVVFVNILLAFFNLLPIPPLDGSKLLKSILPYKASLTIQRLEAILVNGGMLFMILFFYLLFTVFGKFFLIFLMYIFLLFTGVSPVALNLV